MTWMKTKSDILFLKSAIFRPPIRNKRPCLRVFGASLEFSAYRNILIIQAWLSDPDWAPNAVLSIF